MSQQWDFFFYFQKSKVTRNNADSEPKQPFQLQQFVDFWNNEYTFWVLFAFPSLKKINQMKYLMTLSSLQSWSGLNTKENFNGGPCSLPDTTTCRWLSYFLLSMSFIEHELLSSQNCLNKRWNTWQEEYKFKFWNQQKAWRTEEPIRASFFTYLL